MFLKSKKSYRYILALSLLVLFLVGCGQIQGTNWPGVSSQGDRVYVSYQTEVIALDTAQKSQIWSYTNPDNTTAPFYAPVSNNDGTLIVGDSGVSAGIFAGGGFIVGIHSLRDGDSNPPQANWISSEAVSGGVFSEVLRVDGKIFFGTSDNHFVALDEDSGLKVWDFMTGNSVWDKPAYLNGRVYFSSLDRNVYALDADTGDVVWQTSLAGASASAPILNEAENLMYVGSFDGALHALDLDTGDEMWATTSSDWVWGTPALHDGMVYFADMSGNVTAANASTGESIWTALVPESAQSTLVVANNTLFVASGDVQTSVGHLTALSLDGDQVWQSTTNGALSSDPAVTPSGVAVAFVDADSVLQVIVYNLETGAIEWAYTPNAE